MKSIKTAILVAMAASLMGCQSGKSFNPLAAVSTKEAPYSEEELAAVEQAASADTKPVSYTSKLTEHSQSRSAAAPQRSFSTRRS